jgi:hypothetical protein
LTLKHVYITLTSCGCSALPVEGMYNVMLWNAGLRVGHVTQLVPKHPTPHAHTHRAHRLQGCAAPARPSAGTLLVTKHSDSEANRVRAVSRVAGWCRTRGLSVERSTRANQDLSWLKTCNHEMSMLGLRIIAYSRHNNCATPQCCLRLRSTAA